MRAVYCTRAVILWCAFFGLIAAFLLRYGILPEGDPNGGYLSGVYDRTRTSLFYQVMVVAFFGCVAYCMALIVTLDQWIRRASDRGHAARVGLRWVARLVGLHRVGPSSADWQAVGPVGLQLAANPIRDAAVIFPAIGFIGTVVGVTIAVGGLHAVMDTGDTAPLLDGLRFAFDTTFLGLVASVVLTAMLYLIQSRSVILSALTGLR